MSDNDTGRHVHRTQQPLDNPEITTKKDWWNEMCKAAGEKNHWKKKRKVIDKGRDRD
jgi:hypothetical protein